MNRKNNNFNQNNKTSINKGTSSQKPPRPKPQWNTNFGDQQKYKLSALQMIQKKVSLQSKNRQQARLELAERRRKLQQGIIDDQTKKIYQTALISKNIDLNPSLRRNLSQMISYQKQMMQTSQRSKSRNKNVESSITQQLKQTKQFIKKMQKASKAKDITKAVQILQDNGYNQNKDKKIKVHYDEEQKLTPLQNIEETVKFLEQKLFKKKQQKSSSYQNMSNSNNLNNITQSNYYNNTLKNNQYNLQQHNNIDQPQIDYSKIQYDAKKHLKNDQSPILNCYHKQYKLDQQQQDDWFDSIKRMKKIMEAKQKQYQPSNQSTLNKYFDYEVQQSPITIQKKPDLQMKNLHSSISLHKENRFQLANEPQYIPVTNKDQQEVQFSLTINNDSLKIDSDQFFQPIKSISNKKSNTLQEITSVKKKLLIQQMEPQDYDEGSNEISKQYFESFGINKKGGVNFNNQVIRSMKKKKQVNNNNEVDRIKKLLDETKKNLDNLKVQKLQSVQTNYHNRIMDNCISLKKIAR